MQEEAEFGMWMLKTREHGAETGSDWPVRESAK